MGSTTNSIELEEAVLRTLRTMSSSGDGATRSATLGELDIDSLDLVELTQVLVDDHGVTVPPNQLRGVETVGDVVDAVVRAAS